MEESFVWQRTGSAENDAWDDTELISAYDRAYAQIQDHIERRNATSSENPSDQQPPMDWKKGDYCTAVYSGDGRPYEAKIKSIRGSQCVVYFIGYGNEEHEDLSDLQPSKGEDARRAQQAEAEALTSGASSDGNAGRIDLPSTSHDVLQSVFSGGSGENDETSSMLMAWYMSGYHTGYYQALQESQAAGHECHK